jgi:hypothetical protein
MQPRREMFESILRAPLYLSSGAQPVCCPLPSAGISTASGALRLRDCMPFGEVALLRRRIRQEPISDLQIPLIASLGLHEQVPPNSGGTCIKKEKPRGVQSRRDLLRKGGIAPTDLVSTSAFPFRLRTDVSNPNYLLTDRKSGQFR